jgi:hypothetical protein
MVRAAALAFGLALIAAASAPAETVARGVRDGMLALGPKGSPYVAYVQGRSLLIAERSARGRWTATKADSLSKGTQLMAFEVGAAGPVALTLSADNRRLVLVRRRFVGWQRIPIEIHPPARTLLGWPGLALDRRGLPFVGYARWRYPSYNTRLMLARLDAAGRVRKEQITAEGFPKSYAPPPAEPVLIGGHVHVIESYGYRGVVGTLEWLRRKHTWIGNGLDAGVGDFPLGAVFAGVAPNHRLYAVWTESLSSFDGAAPVALAERGSVSITNLILDRALTTGLALAPSGPEVAANEWVGSDDLGLAGTKYDWAGTIVRGDSQVELDGWLAGLATVAPGGRDLLLSGAPGLSWFHSPRRLSTQVSIDATDEGDGSVEISGEVAGATGGRVAVYRERPGEARVLVARVPLSGGAFSLVDRPKVRPLVYRAVYTDPATGIPYAALLRSPIS